MFRQPKKMFVGHIKVLGGPHVARGPEVAQAWSNLTNSKSLDQQYAE